MTKCRIIQHFIEGKLLIFTFITCFPLFKYSWIIIKYVIYPSIYEIEYQSMI